MAENHIRNPALANGLGGSDPTIQRQIRVICGHPSVARYTEDAGPDALTVAAPSERQLLVDLALHFHKSFLLMTNRPCSMLAGGAARWQETFALQFGHTGALRAFLGQRRDRSIETESF
jgi:hypothetical protein